MAPDKQKHLLAGIPMGAILQVAALTLLPGRIWLATALVLGMVLAISYGFELISLITGKGHYDVMDAIASIAGGVAGMGFVLALYAIF